MDIQTCLDKCYPGRILLTLVFFFSRLRYAESDPSLVCVTSPLAVDTASSQPITLQAVVDARYLLEEAYSITFRSRDDPLFVTNSAHVEYGKIGTAKGEKGAKGDKGSFLFDDCGPSVTGPPGLSGEDGSSAVQGPQGQPGPPGQRGDPGQKGDPPDGPAPGPGIYELYCKGEEPSCGSQIHALQCIQGLNGELGGKGFSCQPGPPGEKGEPPKPNLQGAPGRPGNPGLKGSLGEKGEKGVYPIPVDAPQPNCDLSTVKGLPGINLFLGYPGDKGDRGYTGYTGPKGAKGVPGTPGTMGEPGSQGLAGIPGPPGEQGFPGPSTFDSGSPGLFIRPLYRGPNPELSCVSNTVVATETLTLHKPDDNHRKDGRFGVYYCDYASTSKDIEVPVLLYNQDELIPKDAKRTFVVSVEDQLTLCVDERLPKSCVPQLEWTLNGNKTDKLKRWTGSPCIHIKRVTTADAGIYEAYRRPIGRNAKKHAYFIVIVRACPDGRFGLPSCSGTCIACANGGYCNVDDGSCICLHGFRDTSCSSVNGEGTLGTIISISCLDLGHGRSCKGALVCSEEMGCSCAPGWRGIRCDEPCTPGTYGPDCCLSCPPNDPVCNRFTGLPCTDLT